MQAQPAAAEALAEALGGLEQLSGAFTQSLRETDGSAEQESFAAGRFGLLRPDRFFWDIQRPDSQLVVAAQGQLWHYDRDLATATQRPLDATVVTPLQVLAGERDSLQRDFSVSQPEPGVFLLEPRSADAGFSQLRLSLEGGLPVRMQLVDNLGRHMDIRFEGLRVNGLTAADFAFSPPPGVDVFRQ